MKKKVLIFTRDQYGYWTDYYYLSKYLTNKYEIYYACLDYGYKKIFLPDVNVIYISKLQKKSFFYTLKFIFKVIKILYKFKIDIFITYYFQLSFLFRLFIPFKKIILDIRSAGITTNEKKRKRNHKIIKFNTQFFNRTTILAESLRNELNLNPKITSLIPLGAEDNKFDNKKFNKLNLLYIGILNSRNIHETILGLKIFLYRNSNLRQEVTYDIVGFGTDEVESILIKTIQDAKLEDIVIFHGRKTIEESKSFWNKCNVGIVYVPQIHAYQNQPPTKLFEAFFSGMPVIATNTNENKKFVNDDNGILVNDNPEEFADGLELLYKKFNGYDSTIIKNSVKDYSWENITNKLIDVIEGL